MAPFDLSSSNLLLSNCQKSSKGKWDLLNTKKKKFLLVLKSPHSAPRQMFISSVQIYYFWECRPKQWFTNGGQIAHKCPFYAKKWQKLLIPLYKLNFAHKVCYVGSIFANLALNKTVQPISAVKVACYRLEGNGIKNSQKSHYFLLCPIVVTGLMQTTKLFLNTF